MKLLFSMLSLILINSCGSSKETTTMISGAYQVQSLAGHSNLPKKLSIEFNSDNNMVSGSSGCNQFTGNYEISDNKINFGPLASTKMFCSDMPFEDDYLKLLCKVTSYKFEEDSLILQSDDSNLIVATLQKSDLKMNQENPYIIEYSAVSRGNFKNIMVKNNVISIQNDRNSTPISMNLSLEKLSPILEKIEKIDLNKLSTITPPSKDHQFDGAAIANLKVTKNGKTYQTQSFDHGNPPKEIADLVNDLLAFSEKNE